MKAWATASAAGQCSYDRTHTWRSGERIYVLEGGTWRKMFCAGCAVSRHGAAADPGESVETAEASSAPTPLKALASQVAERFDAKAAAAGKDPD